jgi:hypothetical protein
MLVTGAASLARDDTYSGTGWRGFLQLGAADDTPARWLLCACQLSSCSQHMCGVCPPKADEVTMVQGN